MTARFRDKFDDSKRGGLTLIIGTLLVIQGFGVVLTQQIWGTSWGLIAIGQRMFDIPDWTAPALGVLGLVVTIVGFRLSSTE